MKKSAIDERCLPDFKTEIRQHIEDSLLVQQGDEAGALSSAMSDDIFLLVENSSSVISYHLYYDQARQARFNEILCRCWVANTVLEVLEVQDADCNFEMIAQKVITRCGFDHKGVPNWFFNLTRGCLFWRCGN